MFVLIDFYFIFQYNIVKVFFIYLVNKFGGLSMLRRLPISLRFDDDDSEFYEGFIEEKKNNSELSSLILD